ncbi:MAG: SCO family protein [Planctomycetia bacterium]|nr:SCO family protein [Planctomycetia bacterium]
MTCRLFPLLALFAAGCLGSANSRAPRQPTTEPDLDYPVGSFSLTERSGKTVTEKDLRGKVWIASFIFTRCSGPCPIVSSTMGRLQSELKDELTSGKLKLVTFTVDPARDDLATLKAYANARNADPDNWLFLTGDEKILHTLLSEQFKQHVGRNPEGKVGDEYSHSTRLILVDRDGVLRGMYDGIPNKQFPDGQERYEAGLTRLKERVRELIK